MPRAARRRCIFRLCLRLDEHIIHYNFELTVHKSHPSAYIEPLHMGKYPLAPGCNINPILKVFNKILFQSSDFFFEENAHILIVC
jgi:hypothetical protein